MFWSIKLIKTNNLLKCYKKWEHLNDFLPLFNRKSLGRITVISPDRSKPNGHLIIIFWLDLSPVYGKRFSWKRPNQFCPKQKIKKKQKHKSTEQKKTGMNFWEESTP